MNEWVWSIFGIMVADQTGNIGGKSVQLPLGPSQILHGLDRNRSEFSLVRGRRLSAWTLAGRPIAFDRMHSAHVLRFMSHENVQNLVYAAIFWYCHYTHLARQTTSYLLLMYQQTCNLVHLSVTYAYIWDVILCRHYRTKALKPGCVVCLKAND
jgi:hypothetical protein